MAWIDTSGSQHPSCEAEAPLKTIVNTTIDLSQKAEKTKANDDIAPLEALDTCKSILRLDSTHLLPPGFECRDRSHLGFFLCASLPCSTSGPGL